MITVNKINSPEDFSFSRKIRYQVFVIEQKVPPEDEIDEYEDASIHFIAKLNGTPSGTARYRITDTGVKLERFAVLNELRGKGIGSALVEAVLEDINNNPEASGKPIYLHSQVDAIFLYTKYGFQKTGELFDECGIMHSKMIKSPA
ncbi:GNAT family N-acetyltransferase [Bacteroidota bacterium]